MKEKLNIGINKEKESRYNLLLKVKQDAFNDALTYVSTFIKVKDFKAFQSNMSEYFKTEFLTAYGKDFSPLMTYEKICELSNVELHKLEALENQFNGVDIELNPLTLKPVKKADHSIYLTDPIQIEKYKKSKFLIDKLDEIKKQGIDFNPAFLMRCFPNYANYDWSSHELTPNYV